MSPATRLRAVVVNYDSGAYAAACVDSLRATWRGEGRAAADLDVVVVDSASPAPQEPWLERLESDGARVVRAEHNLGYGPAANRGLAADGPGGLGDLDVVLVCNADVVFPRGSLSPLLELLADRADCGCVAPAAFVDPPCELRLPPNPRPTPRWLLRTTLAELSPGAARRLAAERSRAALRVWRARDPLAVDELSGACLVLRRDTLERLGTLFDERYPLYFEDNDLCRRLEGLGLQRVHHPGSRILHHWARSSGAAGELRGDVLTRFRAGRAAYLERHHGAGARALVEQAESAAADIPAEYRFRPIHPLVELGARREPVEIDLPRSADFVLELGMAPVWLLAAGILGAGRVWRCPADSWEWFFEGRYFLRALDLASGELLGAWTFHKTTPSRCEPLDAGEVAAIQAAPSQGSPTA